MKRIWKSVQYFSGARRDGEIKTWLNVQKGNRILLVGCVFSVRMRPQFDDCLPVYFLFNT